MNVLARGREQWQLVSICFLIVLFALGLPFSPALAQQPLTIWHIPHPDDETIGMAGGILAAEAAGHRNIIVFYTQGGASSVIWTLNGYSFSKFHERTLRPAAEGYAPLTREDFRAARVAEARAALHVLGVADEDIVVLDFPDGSLTIEDAMSVMRQFSDLYPDAAHRATSLLDSHPDHQNLGKALLRLAEEHRRHGQDLDIGLYSIYQYNVISTRRHTNVTPMLVADMERKIAALNEFFVWDPPNGRFAIGAHSVPQLFAEAARDPYEYMEIIPHEIPARLLRETKFALSVFPRGLTLDYELGSNWAFRVSSPYHNLRLNAALLRKTPHIANAIRFYAGTAVRPAKSGPTLYLITGAEVRSILVEYKSINAGEIRFGVRVPF